MVNVNTQVTSSMELPFGEYTLFIVAQWLFHLRKERCQSVAVALFIPRSQFFDGVCRGRVVPHPPWITTDSGWKDHRHMCLAFSHGCNPGGVSEIWRLLKRPWEQHLMVTMGLM